MRSERAKTKNATRISRDAERKKGEANAPPYLQMPPEGFVLLEQRQDGLRRLIGDRQGLNAPLLLALQRLQLGAFLRLVRGDQGADARSQGIGQLLGERRLDRELRRTRRQLGKRRVDVGQRGLDRGDQGGRLGQGRNRAGRGNGHNRTRQAHILGRRGDAAGAVGRGQGRDLGGRAVNQVEAVVHSVLDDRRNLIAERGEVGNQGLTARRIDRRVGSREGLLLHLDQQVRN